MPFRILSFDGGGIRGLLAAQMLANLENRLKVPLTEYFQFMAGTSTGSMIAAAIAIGKSTQEIIQLYRERGKNVFPYQSRFSQQRLPLILKYGPSAPKFSDRGLIEMLKELFGNRTLADINPTKVLITSYDTIERQPIIFKSWWSKFANVPMWEACLCSASAPTFFPPHQLKLDGKNLCAIDGGVAANNPSACAIAEAIRLGHRIEDLEVLSIGTGDPTRQILWEQARGWGALQWIWDGRVVKVTMDAPTKIYDYISEYVIGDNTRYLRLQFPLDRQLTAKPLNDDMDDATDKNMDNLMEAANVYMNLPDVLESLERFVGTKKLLRVPDTSKS